MAIKRIVGLSFLFLLGNSYLSAMNTEITKSSIKIAKVDFKKSYCFWTNCYKDCKHNIETLQFDLEKNEIVVKCPNSYSILTTKKINIFEEDDYMVRYRECPPYYNFESVWTIPIAICNKELLNNFNIFQKIYQSKKKKAEKYITTLSLCRNSKIE